jgi:hypothetical protein
MKTLKGKSLTTFVRFGGVHPKKQKGFGTENYHSPPATRGFYALPLICQEFFLLSSMDKYQPGTMPKPLKGKLVGTWEDGDPKYDWSHLTDDDWNNHAKRKKKALSLKRKQFYRIRGDVWHHLGDYIERNEVIASKGSWVKTSMSAWRDAFVKMSLTQRYGDKSGGFDFRTKSVNESKLFGWYSKDHCEVFFDEKV